MPNPEPRPNFELLSSKMTFHLSPITPPYRALGLSKVVGCLLHWELGVERWAFDVDRVRRSLLRGLLFAVLLLPLSFAFAQVDKTPAQVDKTPAQADQTPAQVDEAPYFGNWENDRGDTLQITSDSVKVNDEKPARYDDITEDSDETFFVLQIKDSTELNYFGGNFLHITFGKDPDHFTMSIYKALPDALKQQNEVKRIEWSAPAPEEESEHKEEPKTEEKPDQKSQQADDQKKDEGKKNDQRNGDQGPEKATPSPSATPSPGSP